ncbi:hypothetical protein PENTCL1PPCAC_58, partial [Pristionchus entomophagus]
YLSTVSLMGEESSAAPVNASEGEQKQLRRRDTHKAAIPSLEYATLGAATLLFLRAFNTFITHQQRGQSLVSAAGFLGLSIANEFSIFPFSLVPQKKTEQCGGEEKKE